MTLRILKFSAQEPNQYRSLKGEYWRKDFFSQENIFDMIVLSYQEEFYPHTKADHNFWGWIDIFVVSGGMRHFLYRNSADFKQH